MPALIVINDQNSPDEMTRWVSKLFMFQNVALCPAKLREIMTNAFTGKV